MPTANPDTDYTASAFADIITELYNNTEELEKMSDKSEKYIRKYHSIEAVWNIIKEDFE